MGIHAGLFRCALIAYGATTKSRRVPVGTVTYNQLAGTEMLPIPDAFEQIYGTTVIAFMGLLTQRYMHTRGMTSEQLAAVAVTMREHAQLNPQAAHRDPLTIEDVLSSPIIASPLHRLDCCMISDGAGAIIVASKDFVPETRKPPVWIRGFGESIMHHAGGHTDWSEESRLVVKRACDLAWNMSGVQRSEIDTAMIYDAFAYNVIVDLEGAGFCGIGEGGQFVADGHIKLNGGSLPVNPDRGGMSSNHPGRRGIFMFIEAVRQLRGEATGRQEKNARTAICTATGAAFLARRASAAHILGV
jgi:acetyl-CoA C-acetyltransferase